MSHFAHVQNGIVNQVIVAGPHLCILGAVFVVKCLKEFLGEMSDFSAFNKMDINGSSIQRWLSFCSKLS